MTPLPIAGAQRAGAGRGDRKGGPGRESAMIRVRRCGIATARGIDIEFRRRPRSAPCHVARLTPAIHAAHVRSGAYGCNALVRRVTGHCRVAHSRSGAGLRQPWIAA